MFFFFEPQPDFSWQLSGENFFYVISLGGVGWVGWGGTIIIATHPLMMMTLVWGRGAVLVGGRPRLAIGRGRCVTCVRNSLYNSWHAFSLEILCHTLEYTFCVASSPPREETVVAGSGRWHTASKWVVFWLDLGWCIMPSGQDLCTVAFC